MPNLFFSGRIPPDLHERVEQYVSETGESKTQVLINALVAYLNFPISIQKPSPASQISKEIFSALEERVKALEELVEATKESQNSIISVIDTDNIPEFGLEITPLTQAEQFDNEIDNNKIDNDNKQLEISNVINFDNENNEPIISKMLTTYGPMSESNMAKWSKRDRGILRKHRLTLETNGASMDTPLPLEVDGKLYHLKCVGKGKKYGSQIVKEWVAELVDNVDNADNSIITHREDSDSLLLP